MTKRGILLLVLLCSVPAFPLFCADDDRALLVRGPKLGKGIEYFGVNAIPYELGEYRFKDLTFSAYFIRRYIPSLPGWEKKDCAKNRFRLLSKESEDALLYEGEEAWTVLFVFPKNTAEACLLMDRFLDRLRFFLNLGTGSPLPAVVETAPPRRR